LKVIPVNKITIVGAGRVGESTAQLIAEQDLCKELMLLDIREGVPQGVALDIQETSPLLGFDTRVNGCNLPEGLKDSGLVIVTAGVPRKVGMTASDVLDINVKVIDDIVDSVVSYAPDAIIMLVSNPVATLTYEAFLRSGFDRRRILGQAGVLDATRMASFIAMETGFSSKDISAMVLGGHGNTMIPMIRFTTISGIPVEHFVEPDIIQDIIERTRNGGAEILSLRQTSSAYDAPAAAITAMVDAIVHDRRRILPAVAILQGEYGQSDMAMGVPCVLSDCGVEKVIELPLNDVEQAMFDDTVASIRADINNLK
jgi:malate dehydrogenase